MAYKEVNGLTELQSEFKKWTDKVKSLSMAKSLHAAPKPDLPLQLLDIKHGISHWVLGLRVDKGELNARLGDITKDRLRAAPDEIKDLLKNFAAQCRKKPLQEGELAKYFEELNPVDKLALVAWMAADIASRPALPPGLKPQAEREAEARNFVEATPAKQPEQVVAQTVKPGNTAGG